MSGIDVQDYNTGDINNLQDPTDPHEQVEKAFMNKLAAALTRFEEVLLMGDATMTIADLQSFIEMRGNALDIFNDPQVAEWLDHMRKIRRCRYRRYAVGS